MVSCLLESDHVRQSQDHMRQETLMRVATLLCRVSDESCDHHCRSCNTGIPTTFGTTLQSRDILIVVDITVGCDAPDDVTTRL